MSDLKGRSSKQTPAKQPASGDKQITKSDLNKIEAYADKLFAKLNIDVEFTRHFLDRVNDERNKRQITSAELTRLFKQTYQKYGKKIAKMGPDAQAVIQDMKTDVNMPFVLNLDMKNNELDLVAKTVMRKKNFMTSNQKLKLESEKEKPCGCAIDDECGCDDQELNEAEYQGRQVTLNKPFRTPGGPKKFAVYVKNEKGNVVKVTFGDPNMEIKRDDPESRKSFRARHNCSDKKDKTTAGYWSCYQWRAGSKVEESVSGKKFSSFLAEAEKAKENKQIKLSGKKDEIIVNPEMRDSEGNTDNI